MKIIKFNEIVGFDDSETRDRLEIPNMRGEFDASNKDMKPAYIPSDKVDSISEVKKILYKYPILNDFNKNTKRIEGSILSSLFATSKAPIGGVEYYSQLSFAYHNNQYYIGTIFRDRLDKDLENWTKYSSYFQNIEDVYTVVESFIETCKKIGVLESSDISRYSSFDN